MPKISGIPHLRAVRALEKAGFRVARQGKHIVMTDGKRIVTIPRHDPVDAITMGGVAPGRRPRRAPISPTSVRVPEEAQHATTGPAIVRPGTAQGLVSSASKMKRVFNVIIDPKTFDRFKSALRDQAARPIAPIPVLSANACPRQSAPAT